MTAKKKPAKLRPDVVEVAFRVFQEATGEAPKTLPPSERLDRKEKNLEAVKRGAVGGRLGGKARARALTKAQRSDIALKGAQARWSNKSDE